MTERSIFLAVLELDDPAERAAYLDRACAGDPSLRGQVDRLLQAHEDTGPFMERPAAAHVTTTVGESGPERPGTVIGPYKLLEQIGEGGFGFVFMAEQQQPLRRKVALKVLKPGMDTRQVVARFEAERQALALMDHPNIAHIFDGGETAAGRPYFVMELVRGVPITDFCDHNHLAIRQRLELFVDICQAVQHAHQKGIIHRDLKPSNVLVTLHDDRPVVKVIDFGVAKATGQQLTDKTVFTNFAQMIGTPLYMSPEQAQMSGLDVDTRSDLYSLGVLLYELLTGTTPFDKERLRTVGYDEMRRIIREEEPPRPSTRFSTLGQGAATVSVNRGSDPKRLGQVFRGELDWIVMKSLEKDRNRRYETASAFAADVQRYLAGEPVQAVPPSARYRLGKFVRRNRAALLTVGLVMLAMFLGTAISIWQAFRATIAEREAETNFAEARAAVDEMLLRVSDERLRDVPQSYPVRKALLEDALKFYEGFMRKRPADLHIRLKNAQILESVGELQWRMSRLTDADQSLRRAVAIAKTLVAEDPAQAEHREALARTQESLAASLAWGTQTQESEEGFRRAIALWADLLREFPANREYRVGVRRCESSLAQLLMRIGRPAGFDEAETLLRQAVTASRELVDQLPDNVSHRKQLVTDSLILAQLFERRGKPDRAEEGLRQTLADAERLIALSPNGESPRRLYARCLLQRGRLLSSLGRHPEAVALSLKALEVRELLVRDFPEIRDFQSWLANILYRDVGPELRKTQPKQAETAFRRALGIYEELAKLESRNASDLRRKMVACRTQLASLLFATDRREEAEALWHQAWVDAEALTRAELKKGHLIGDLLKVWPETPLAEAERVYHKALPLLDWLVEQAPAHSNHRASATLYRRKLILLLIHSGKPEDAERQWLQALQLCGKLATKFPDQPHYGGEVARSQLEVANQLRNEKRYKEAEQLTRKAIKTCEKLAADFPGRVDCRADLARAYSGLGNLMSAAGQGQEAEQARRRALALGNKLTKEFPNTAEHWSNLGIVHADLMQWKEAVACLTRAIRLKPDGWVAWQYRGYAHGGLGHWEESIADLTRSLELYRNSSWTWVRRGQGYSALRQWDRAVADFAQALELGNTEPWVFVWKAAAHANLSQPDQALVELRQAVIHGFRDANHLRFASDFESVRAREDFKRLLMGLEEK